VGDYQDVGEEDLKTKAALASGEILSFFILFSTNLLLVEQSLGVAALQSCHHRIRFGRALTNSVRSQQGFCRPLGFSRFPKKHAVV
jgi:hypothetical protein